ncbi:MAG: RimK family alpha-L-glutamate ligase [Candidatus Gracilibacteria bacterium]
MKPIQIGILDFSYISHLRSARTASISTPREIKLLKKAVEDQGHIAKIYKVEKCQLYFDNRKPLILYKNQPIKGCDVLIPRVSVSGDIDLEISIVKQFKMLGVPVVNDYLPTARAKNKLRTLQILTHRGIPVPRTLVVRKLEFLDEGIEKVGGYPVIIKSPFGSYGVGVAIAESRRSLYSSLDMVWKTTASSIILIQEYVAEAEGSDFRAYVIGDKVVASMQRRATKGDFRSNLHYGGEAVKIKLSAEEQHLAVRATQALGLDVSGVDLLRTKNGPVVMEVNANPGFEGLMKVTGVDIPGEMVKYAVSLYKKHLESVKKKKAGD